MPTATTPESTTASKASSNRAVAKATMGIFALHFVRFVVGFVAQPLIAHNLGLRWQADVYQVATDTVQRFWLVFEKVVNPAFLPQFIAALKEDGEEKAWQLASTAVWLLSALLLASSALGWVFMPKLIGALSQKASQEEIDLTIRIGRLLMPCVFVLSLSSLTYTILNGYKRFAWAAMGDVFWKCGVFLGAAVAYKLYGHELTELAKIKLPTTAQEARLGELAIKSLWIIVGGFAAGAIGKLVPHLFAIGGKWSKLRPRVDFSDPRARKMLVLALPLLFGIVVSETRGFYMSHLADDPSIPVEAGRFTLKISRMIIDTLTQVFPYALSIGIFPYLADMARERDRQPMTDLVVRSLRVCFFVFVPITAILIAVRFPLLRAVWQGGRLTAADTLEIAPPFIAYSLGLVGFACEMMLGQTFYALTRTWTPTIIGLVISVVWFFFAKIGVENLGWQLVAIAGAESFSKSLKCVIMWVMLRPHLGEINGMKNLAFFAKIVVGSILAAIVAYFLAKFLVPDTGKAKMLLGIVISGSVAMALFLGVSIALKVEETDFLKRLKRR